MAFTPSDLALVDATVGELVRRRQPPVELQDQLRLELEIDGQAATIVTVRPAFHDPTRETRIPVARFRFNRTKEAWTLYWMRRDRKWHRWPEAPPGASLADLVRVVDEDAYGAFWG